MREPWRDEELLRWVRHAPEVEGKLSKLVRRGEEPWAEEANKLWGEKEAAKIGATLAAGRYAVREGKLKFDRRPPPPGVLDMEALSDRVLQNYICCGLNLKPNQINDMIHTIVPVCHADVAFLDGPTKRNLLKVSLANLDPCS